MLGFNILRLEMILRKNHKGCHPLTRIPFNDSAKIKTFYL